MEKMRVRMMVFHASKLKQRATHIAVRADEKSVCAFVRKFVMNQADNYHFGN